jgi:uncharacterized membrane protein YdbT with pleckstrin-like domain
MRTQELLTGERLVAVYKQHWVVVLPAVTFWAVGGLVVLTGLALLPLAPQARLTLGLAVLVLAVLGLTVAILRWRSTEVVLTDQRVILKEGVVGRFSRSIAIDRIQDLTTYQGLWGRTWGFGDIELESAGREGGEWLMKMPHPQWIGNAIFSQIESRRAFYR